MLPLKSRNYRQLRQHYIKLLFNKKRQLIGAYESESPKRILLAKISLIRVLRELSDEDLGGTKQMKWGLQLETIFKAGVDPELPWESLADLPWPKVADVIEQSLDFHV